MAVRTNCHPRVNQTIVKVVVIGGRMAVGHEFDENTESCHDLKESCWSETNNDRTNADFRPRCGRSIPQSGRREENLRESLVEIDHASLDCIDCQFEEDWEGRRDPKEWSLEDPKEE